MWTVPQRSRQRWQQRTPETPRTTRFVALGSVEVLAVVEVPGRRFSCARLKGLSYGFECSRAFWKRQSGLVNDRVCQSSSVVPGGLFHGTIRETQGKWPSLFAAPHDNRYCVTVVLFSMRIRLQPSNGLVESQRNELLGVALKPDCNVDITISGNWDFAGIVCMCVERLGSSRHTQVKLAACRRAP